MGGVNNSLSPTTYTELYFNNPNRLKDPTSKKIIINTDDERYKNEIYQVIRTMQKLFLISNFKG